MARLRVLVLAGFMLFFGTINTLTTKFQDMTVVGVGPDGKPLTFNHPAVQSFFMFFGELLCLAPHFLGEWRLASSRSRVKRRQELQRRGAAFRLRRVLAFAAPACCDAVATTLLNIGLFYTYASTYQMLRGTLVLFAGFFTVTVLRRRLYIHHWLGMVLITGGAALVGAASVLSSHHGGAPAPAPSPSPAPFPSPVPSPVPSPSSPGLVLDGLTVGAGGGGGGGLLLGWRKLALAALGSDPGVDAAAAPLFGDLCVVAAQAFTALQFILEEKFVADFRVPTLLAVGLEGLWGCGVCAVALPLLEAVRVGPGHRPLDSAAQAFREVVAHGPLAASVGVTVVSIGFFNFFGISVTKALSGAARATIDACRTLFVWLVSLWLGWEHFLPLQVVGFAVLFSGTSLYNELIRICLPTPEAEEELLEGAEGSGSSGSASGSESGGEEEDGYGGGYGGGGRNAASAAAAALWRAAGGGKDVEGGSLNEPLLQSGPAALGRTGSGGGSPIKAITSIAAAAGPAPAGGGVGGVGGYGPIGASVAAAAAAGGQGAVAAAAAAAAAGAVGVAARGRRRGTGRDSSDSEYTMARSMRLGQNTLQPHALDADTDAEPGADSDTLGGSSPGGLSYTAGSAAAGGGLLSGGGGGGGGHPNIPEGDEEGDLVGCMSGIDPVPTSPVRNVTRGSHGAAAAGGGGGGGGSQRVSIAIGPHGMLSGGVGRGGGGGRDGGGGGGGVPIAVPPGRRQ